MHGIGAAGHGPEPISAHRRSSAQSERVLRVSRSVAARNPHIGWPSRSKSRFASAAKSDSLAVPQSSGIPSPSRSAAADREFGVPGVGTWRNTNLFWSPAPALPRRRIAADHRERRRTHGDRRKEPKAPYRKFEIAICAQLWLAIGGKDGVAFAARKLNGAIW